MNILSGYTFDVVDLDSGDVTSHLSEIDVASKIGADVIDLGCDLEWYDRVYYPRVNARWVIERIKIEGNA